MKRNIPFIMTIVMLALTACSGGDDDIVTPPPTPEGAVIVGITTDIQTRASVKNSFTNGDEMNIWAKTYGSPSAPDIVNNIKATNNNSTWTIDPSILLDNKTRKNAFLYALYPYSSNYSSIPKEIPVDVTKQIDMLYSGSYVPVTYTTHTGKLTMKHALSLATFNIFSDGYTGSGQLQSITLYGDSIYTDGVMSVENGKIAGSKKGDLTVAFDKAIGNQGWSDDIPQIWVIPLPINTKSTKAFLKAVVDGREYVTTFPEVEMKIGFQYIFHLVLTNNGLEFIPDQTTTISLNDQDEGVQTLSAHGILSVSHNTEGEFSSLIMNGDNVFGNINWGDNTKDSYVDGISHDYSNGAAHQIIVETWNSIGFHLRTIKNITTIDVSKYE